MHLDRPFRGIFISLSMIMAAAGGCGSEDKEVTGTASFSSTNPCPPDSLVDDGVEVPGDRIYAFPEEHNHWSAVVMTVPEAPARVVAFEYYGVPRGLVEEPAGSQMAHQAAVYVTDEARPSNSPSYHEVFDAGEGSGDDILDWRPVEHVLQEPLLVQPGQYLVVAIRQPAESDGSRAFRTGGCFAPETATSMWWSYAAEPPFEWEQLPAAQFTVNYVSVTYTPGD
jgi:hypothetical protein